MKRYKHIIMMIMLVIKKKAIVDLKPKITHSPWQQGDGKKKRI